MKTFKIKDLVISVGTAENARITATICAVPSHFCHWPTLCGHFTCGGCSVLYCSHLPSLIPTDITIWKTTTPIQQTVDEIEEKELLEFKNHLADLQKYVDVKIKEAPNQLDNLEKKLNEAIEEIKAQKGKFRPR